MAQSYSPHLPNKMAPSLADAVSTLIPFCLRTQQMQFFLALYSLTFLS